MRRCPVRWTQADRERYARSAAPEAILAELKIARAAQARAAELTGWLEVLLARRVRQVTDGTWPPPREEGT
jgi:hypothetical protein